jgi:F-type H+-transporting ATPase subunit epsilon
MAEVKLEIVSPERLVISETASSVTVPGADGYFTVVGEHAPLMTVLKPGFVTVVSGGATHVFYVAGGFADVSPEGLTILAEQAKPANELSRAEIDAAIAEAQRAVDAAVTPEAKSLATEKLDAWRNLLLEFGTVGATAH